MRGEVASLQGTWCQQYTISVHVEAGTANAHHQWWYCIWTEAFQRQQMQRAKSEGYESWNEKPLIDKIPILDPQKFKL